MWLPWMRRSGSRFATEPRRRWPVKSVDGRNSGARSPSAQPPVVSTATRRPAKLAFGEIACHRLPKQPIDQPDRHLMSAPPSATPANAAYRRLRLHCAKRGSYAAA
uniref:Uncharacterized protein n=1 Tax=Plectus sambesii TaxID=2011161 RepID=A0A914WU70_9BILA